VFEPMQPTKKGLPAKFVTGFAVGAVLSFGMCGVGLCSGGVGDSWWGHTASAFAYCFFVCVVGLVASLIWWRIDSSSKRDDR